MATEPWLEVSFEGKGQQTETCRLFVFRNKPRLQNLSTGELLDLEVGSELHEDRSCLVMLPQDEEDAADVKEILLRDIFEMSLGEDDTGETVRHPQELSRHRGLEAALADRSADVVADRVLPFSHASAHAAGVLGEVFAALDG